MRSSPNFLAVSRRGLGLHLSMEVSDLSTDRLASPAGSEVPEINGVIATPKLPLFARYGRKTVVVAIIGILQGVIIVVNEVFDLVDNLAIH